MTSEIKLRERCGSCDGLGVYYAAHDWTGGVPCWTCRGRGYVERTMRRPMTKWARQYDREQREAARRAIVGE